MVLPPAVRRTVELLRSAGTRLAFLAPLLSRLFVAWAFHATGQGKLANPDNVVAFFTALGIPAPAANAWFVSHLEYYGAILLGLGALTRPVAALLASTMGVALATADRDALLGALSSSGDADVTGVAPLTLLVPLVWLALHGAGWLSVDALVARLRGARGAEAPAVS